MLPPDFASCLGVVPACTAAKEFFNAIKARCCPGNQFQKLKVVFNLLDVLVENGAGQPKPNSTIILTLCRTFATFKNLGIKADELEGLLAQAACHAPSTLDQMEFAQLVMEAILAKGNEKLSLTFVGQVILNTLQKNNESTQCSSLFIYCVSYPPEPQNFYSRLCSPHFPKPVVSAGDVRQPPEHLVDKFGGSCFHCGHTGHWRADFPHTKGVSNPNPRPIFPGPSRPMRQGTPDCCSQPFSSSHYQ
ncbi:hypothetical protein O181_019507 [Austropuccinia psidii MF-1]|uniref:CCHC-type domain-containing protein n=1 Tax=Austropuccinia psidii MF-1 TaxID=1389203 RepID=A0A9Q3CBP5_9BASI|nr:hypothetical protein [Austropuccinia psidii MF-1]